MKKYLSSNSDTIKRLFSFFLSLSPFPILVRFPSSGAIETRKRKNHTKTECSTQSPNPYRPKYNIFSPNISLDACQNPHAPPPHRSSNCVPIPISSCSPIICRRVHSRMPDSRSAILVALLLLLLDGRVDKVVIDAILPLDDEVEA